MGFQANAEAKHARGELESIDEYIAIEAVFIVWFVVESIIRFLGNPLSICKDRFLQFDLLVVTLSAIELGILKPLGILDESSLGVSLFVVFRVLRLTRAVKLVRAVQFCQPLYTMLKAVWHSKSNFICVLMLLAVLIFTTALVLMSLVGPVSGLSEDELPVGVGERFSSIERTMVALLETLLRGEEWGPKIVRPLLSDPDSALAGVVFILFALSGQFFFMNLVSGLFIEEMFKTVKVNNEHFEQESMNFDGHGARKLRQVFREIGDGRKALAWKEFSKGLARHPDLVMQLGINMELAQALFKQLAFDSSHKVNIDHFIFGMLKLTRQSKTIDMLVIDYQQQRAQRDISRLSRRFGRDVKRLGRGMQTLADRLGHTLHECKPLRSTLNARLEQQIRRVGRKTTSEGHFMNSEALSQADSDRSPTDVIDGGVAGPSTGAGRVA